MQPKEEHFKQSIVTTELGYDKVAAHITTAVHLPSLISEDGYKAIRQLLILCLAKEYSAFTEGKEYVKDTKNIEDTRDEVIKLFSNAAELAFSQELESILSSRKAQDEAIEAVLNIFDTQS